MTEARRKVGRRTAAVGATGALVGLAFAGVGAAPDAAAASGGSVAVPVGVSAGTLPGGQVFGNTDPSTPETVSFILKERNISSLEHSVELGMTRYLSVSQFAARYGASPDTIRQVTTYLAKYGIKTQVYADNVDVVATGTAGEFDKALAVTQHQYHVPRQVGRHGNPSIPAQTVHGTRQRPKLPRSFANQIAAILGLTNYSAFSTNTAHVDTTVARPKAGSTNSCEALSGLPDACNTPADFASRYGLKPLYNRANGAGQTLAIVTLAALDPGAPQYFWQNVLGMKPTGRTVTVQNIDGGPGAPSDASGTGETDLDTEQSGALAPGANVIVYQAPNTDSGFADAFFSAASQNTASTVSASWGESETEILASIASGVESSGYQAAFDEAYLEMGAQGQSAFASSGDEAAYDATADLGSTNLAVDNPADSPYVTSAGGTTTPWSGTLTSATASVNVSVPAERTWGWDYLWQPVATLKGISLVQSAQTQVVGSGGGYSATEPRPSYQRALPGISDYSAVQYLTPTDVQTVSGIQVPTTWSFNPTPSVTTGSTNKGRVEPDLSTDADPYSGYLLYEPSTSPALQGGWGGTSFVAPQLNGSAAVIDQYVGHRIGLWNPALYALADTPNSPVSPINTSGTSSDNIFYTGSAEALYNPGSGLGTPNLALFAKELNHLLR